MKQLKSQDFKKATVYACGLENHTEKGYRKESAVQETPLQDLFKKQAPQTPIRKVGVER